MKHIKLFNESNEYYWEVDKHDQNDGDSISGKFKFSDYEKKILKKIKTDDTNIVYHKNLIEIITDLTVKNGGWGNSSWIIRRWISYQIWRYDDEWFDITERDMKSDGNTANMSMDIDYYDRCIREKYYKCDQFEGLVKFLKDKGLLK